MNIRRFVLLFIVASLAILLAACGSSSSPQQVTLAFSPGNAPPSSMTAGAMTPLAVTITNGSANATVTWSVSCGSAGACGSFSLMSTMSTDPTMYTAPLAVPTGGTVTVTATYSGMGMATPLSATITINAPPIAVSFNPAPPTSVLISSQTPITANVVNDPQTAGVAWTVTCQSAQCGSFNPTSTPSGTPTGYIAPSTVPTGSMVTVTATSVTDKTKFASTNITITSNVTVGFTTSPPPSMDTSTMIPLAATVGSDPNTAGVNWTVTCGQAQCGTFVPTQTLSMIPTSYTAPSNGPSGGFAVTFTPNDGPPSSVTAGTTAQFSATVSMNVMVTATSVTDFTKTATAVITVVDLPGVNWTVTCGSAGACGSFNPNPSDSGVDTTYTAPPAVPTGNTVMVTATSVNDNTKTDSATITINPAPTTLPAGNYVFQVTGQDNDGPSLTQPVPFTVAGAFSVNSNGEITGGEQDFIDPLGALPLDAIAGNSATTPSTITVTKDGNLQIVLQTGDAAINGDGHETLNVALVTSSSGVITWYDSFAAGVGTLSQQVASAAALLPKNGYAFLAAGADPNATPMPVAIGGIINIDDLAGGIGTISGAGSIFDINDSFENIVKQSQKFAASTVAGPTGAPDFPDAFGRVTFSLNPKPASGVKEIGFAGYIVNSSAIALVETSDNYLGAIGGIALSQGSSNTGNFSNASISGLSYALGDQGEDSVNPLNFAGSITFNSANSVSGTTTFNDLVLQQTASITAGTWAIDTTGRATITGLTGTDLNPSGPSAILNLYLDGNGNALTASMDKFDVTSGPAYQQTAGAAFVSGTNYALDGTGISAATGSPLPWSAAGAINFTNSGTIGTGSFTDFNYFNATMPTAECGAPASTTCSDVPLTGTLSSNMGPITGFGADSILAGSPTSDTFNFYLIDSDHAFGIETDATQLGLLYLVDPPTPRVPKNAKRTRK